MAQDTIPTTQEELAQQVRSRRLKALAALEIEAAPVKEKEQVRVFSWRSREAEIAERRMADEKQDRRVFRRVA